MNPIDLENDIINDLIDKKLIGIKTSFEDEGADFVDVLFLKTFCDRNNIPLTLKISGGEAIRDIKDANKLYISKIVAPMLESKFALEKFVQSSDKFYTVENKKLSMNVESKTCYDNIEDIFSSKYITSLSSITVGRGDLVQSFDYDRYNGSVDSDFVFDICVNVFTKSREKGLGCTLGGSMTTDSKTFVTKLIEMNLLDNFETRNVILSKYALNHYRFEDLIDSALIFELNYLKGKREYYNNLYSQDIARINKLSKNYV
jgi:4-hydroxy-2-oxoheptanedioate aldolase